ncbi:fluoride efflux transporter CrcB [Clostridium guangxiense]|uniref:fluoride efflux transporter CrcB n=1 Tax=Clostridium guangxiense TaxID=1662055 RepID=UPI001E41D037|nr:fluoride efflux transporter CrcB [Clostridium guangxiense]MCD2345734.1 fluoride efflux transporter CrcB [Clostridium guangxiense]
MKKYLLIAGGGALGAILRFIIKNINFYNYKEAIPLNTLIINITGSFVLALISTIAIENLELDNDIRLGITTGFIGAYTTFSTMCKETVGLINHGLYFSSILYISFSVIFGLCFAYFGVIVARKGVSRFFNKKTEDNEEEKIS